MKRKIVYITGLLAAALFYTACESDFLDRSEKNRQVYEYVVTQGYGLLANNGMAAYSYLREWTSLGSNAMLAAACDEADMADKAATVQRFNTGGWNKFSNPDEVMAWYYRGIVQTHKFIENSEDYRNILAIGDTFTIVSKQNYLRSCDLMYKLRAENRVLRAYFYFELIKRYGGVPILQEPLSVNETNLPPRNTFDECVTYILSELDAAYPDIIDHWLNYEIPDFSLPGGDEAIIGTGRGNVAGSTETGYLGRIEKPFVQAFRLRVLLYAASPLFNPTGDVAKWQAAAAAGHEFLTNTDYDAWKYLYSNYEQLFTQKNQSHLTSRYGSNTGIIFSVAQTQGGFQTTIWEQWNYPVGITGGGRKVTAPSQNLVDAYEMQATGLPITAGPASGYDPDDPYTGRDPRLRWTVGINGDIFGKSVGGADRPIQSYIGGPDAIGAKEGATTTGYYLRKMVNPDIDLSSAGGSKRAFIFMRYAEVLLNYAEAMNEAYGPDAKPTINGTPAVYSAVEAVNLVRARAGMPDFPAGMTVADFRTKLQNERRVEMAFEEQRFFDVRRWKIAETTESADLMGMRVVSLDPPTNSIFSYTKFKVEDRVFDATKMYLYPIPEAQVIINGWQQNPGW